MTKSALREWYAREGLRCPDCMLYAEPDNGRFYRNGRSKIFLAMKAGFSGFDLTIKRKILMQIKLTFFLLTVAFLHASATGFPQSVTFSGRKVPLEKVLPEIKKQTGYGIIYNSSTLQGASPVTIDVKNMPLADFMQLLLEGQPLTSSITSKTIILTRKPVEDPSLFAFLTTAPVKGIVRDGDGHPLAGATVKVKNTAAGTSTGTDGKFSLDVNKGDILVISFIGFKTIEQEITAEHLRNGIIIAMTPSDSELNEVTVSTGYWTSSKRKSVGNIAKVVAEDIERQPVTSPLMALQGRVAGVEITPTSGAPGSAVKIRVRGQNSIRTNLTGDGTEGNYPLYVIDGMPVNSAPLRTSNIFVVEQGFDPLQAINPADIESIEILKDADATAIYGSRGANGVVLVTTKNRKASRRLSIDINAYKGVGEVVNRVDLLNTEQYLELRKEGIRNDGQGAEDIFNHPTQGLSFFADLKLWDTTAYTDWQDVVLGGRASINDAQMSISGGSETTSFNIGGAYHNETTIFPGDFGYKRYTAHFGVNHVSLNGKFQLGLVFTYGSTDNKLFNSQNFWSSAIWLAPNAPKLYNPDGTLNWALGPTGRPTWTNPMAEFRKTHHAKDRNLVSALNLGYEIAKGLTLRTQMGFTDLMQQEVLTYPKSSFSPTSTQQPSHRSRLALRRTWSVEPQIDYHITAGDHSFNTLLGATWQQSTDESSLSTGEGYSSDAFLGTLTAATNVTVRANNTEYRYSALFARVGYDYKGIYLVNLTGRRDGSSRFGPENRFGNFGAIGAAWIFSDMPWMTPHQHWLSFGKLRSSYGITGNDQIGDSKFMKTYTITTSPYHNITSLQPTALFNPDLHWETTRKWEAGIELGFLKNKITLEASWYNNRSSNQLVQYQLPDVTGFTNILSNFDATVQNTGWEFLLTTRNISRKHFNWQTSFMLSWNRDKLISFPGIELSPYASNHQIGKPLALFSGYIWKGVNPLTGLHEFEDITGDGVADYQDITPTKPQRTNYYGSINNTLRIHGIELNFLVQLGDKWANTLYYYTFPGGRSNFPVEIMERWQKEKDVTKIQKATAGISSDGAEWMYSNYTQSDALINSIFFARLKTLTLSHAIQQKLANKMKLQMLRVFIQGQNLITVSNFNGWDPETVGALPPLRILSAGLQVKL